jgi:hypothetical protein
LEDQRDVGIIALKKPLRARFNGWLATNFDWVLKRGWIEVEAEVQDCTAIRTSHSARSTQPRWGGYTVAFNYKIDGETYDGVTNTLDEVQPGDRFLIRCNPQHPQENNTFDSETNWVTALSGILWTAIVLAFLAYYVWDRFGRK